jgi:hypothetical protein
MLVRCTRSRRRLLHRARLSLAAVVLSAVGCATNASPTARTANTAAQVSMIVGVPLAVGVGLTRTHDAKLRDADGRLVPVRDQEGQQHIVEGLVIGGITAAVAAVCWGLMFYADATEAPAAAPATPSEPVLEPALVGDAPPSP